MEVFIFKGRSGFCGATKSASGSNLPDVAGPWYFLKKTRLSRERGINLNIALSDIKTTGYHLLNGDDISGSQN